MLSYQNVSAKLWQCAELNTENHLNEVTIWLSPGDWGGRWWAVPFVLSIILWSFRNFIQELTVLKVMSLLAYFTNSSLRFAHYYRLYFSQPPMRKHRKAVFSTDVKDCPEKFRFEEVGIGGFQATFSYTWTWTAFEINSSWHKRSDEWNSVHRLYSNVLILY